MLDSTVKVESELDVDDSDMTLSDCVKLTGSLPETAAEALVYVAADGIVYEAIPNEGSFTAWLPYDTDISSAEVYVTK